jgi:hypothetical protein
LRESHTISDGEIVYTIVETMGDAGGRTSGGTMAANDAAVPLLSEEDGESAVASMEDQWQQEMSVYEVCRLNTCDPRDFSSDLSSGKIQNSEG